MSAPTLARVPAGVTTGGQFSASARGEADLTLSARAPASVAPPKLTATQRDALRALGETGKQWPAGRGRYAIDNGSDSRYSARTLDALVEAGAARCVISLPGSSGVMPYYESTLTAQHDRDSGTWTVTAPDEVADDAYVAAIIHGHRTRMAPRWSYTPEALTITRGESADGTTTFAVKVAGQIPGGDEARAARVAGREAALPLARGDRQVRWIETMSSGYVYGSEFAHPHAAGAQASFESLVARLREGGVDVVEEPAGTRGGVGWRIAGVTGR